MVNCRFGVTRSGVVAFVAGLLLLAAPAAEAQFLTAPPPGSVYRDYTQTMASNLKDWRVTDPTAPAGSGTPDNNPTTYLPNSVLNLTIADLQGATHAEAIIDTWGGHPGTTNKRLRFNGNAYLTVPELGTTPTSGQCYTQEWNAVVEIPLAHLVQGNNTFEGTSGGQTCHSFNWGQWGWFTITVRVYYNPALKTEPTGSITSPTNGGSVTANPTIVASASSGVGIGKVDFLAYYEGPDTDGDGVYLQYHESYRRAELTTAFVYAGHVGTASAPPYQVIWDTSLVPSQPAGGVKLVARICDTTGLCTVSSEVTGLTLSRPTRIVKLYKPASVEEAFWVSLGSGTTKSATFNVTEDLAQALSAQVVIPTWNGIDGQIEPGDTHDTKLNPGTAEEYVFPNYGASHHYKLDVLNVPVGSLRPGTNTIQFFSDSHHHGIEVLWPGPQLVVTYNNPLANCGNGSLNANEQCDDGNLVSGDGCSDSCAIEFCGDTILQAALGEQCDDGNTANGDGCSAACQREPRCGDGTLDPGEQCDQGNLINGDGCSQYCRIEPVCGNGVVHALEACDDGNTTAGDGCSPTCAIEQFGANVVTNGNFAGGTSPWFFNTDQSATFSVVSGEARVAIGTPGNNVQLYQINIALDGSSRYRLQVKGRNTNGDNADVYIQKHTAPYTNYGLSTVLNLTPTMQQFDVLFTTTAGNKTDGRLMLWLSPYDSAGQTYFFDDVAVQKVIVSCGNGFREGPEQCDDGNLVIGDGCSWGCRIEPFCGDGNLDPGEQCDNGASNSNSAPNACRTNCLVARCGDGALDNGETCDGGGPTPTCDTNCTPAICGDGTVNPAAGEECDNGASNSNTTPNACRTTCQTAGCGDGVLDLGETCDPGAETAACDTNCTPRVCGDGTLNATAGETCDDGNTNSGDGCRADCRIEGCGDGILGATEQCDDGNNDSEDGCSATCFVEICGDGIAQLPEQCDDGNSADGDGCSASCVLEAQAPAPNQFRGPRPGEVYKEFSRIIGGVKDWRVTDPDATSPGTGPTNNPSVYLPNSVMQLTIDDLQGAVRAEATIEMWGGHAGTSNKRFRFNSNPYLPIPELQTTPSSGECYVQQWDVTIDVPLAHLVQGLNTLDGTCTGQTCFDNDWGQWGWYGILVRVYYDPQTKAHPTGQITSPAAGVTVGSNPLIAATTSANVNRVDFLAYYEGVDYDGDGRYLEYHEAYHRLPDDVAVSISRHVGTDTAAPFQAVWDTSLVPDQTAAHVKLLARVRDTNGVWYVTPEVANLALVRSGTSVKLYRSENVPQRYWVTNEIFEPLKAHNFTVPAEDNLAAAQSAKFIIASWNGINGGAQPGGTQTTSINSFVVASPFGQNHFYGFDIIDVPTSALIPGTNSVSFLNLSEAHGIEVLWPGTQMVVTYSTPIGSCGNSTLQAGETCDDGNAVNGDGCDAYCHVESCGDGVTQPGIGEECDDGNRVANDGCDEYCVAEICGDGIVQGAEQCDDGNTAGNDGCSAACRFEICGDGIAQTGEECDDANLVDSDGCTAACRHRPIAAYGFEETSGLVAIDATGNGNNGALVGAVTRTASGYFGRAVDFPGTGGGRVDLGNLNVPGSGLTLSLWFRPDDFDIADARLISKATGLNDADHYWMLSTVGQSGLRLRFGLQTSVGGAAFVVASATLTPGQWTHVAGTYDGTTMRLYQNGALVGSLAKTGSVATSAAAPVWIGDAPVASGKFFDGRIDEVQIDNRAHNEAEIAADMIHAVALCGNGALDSGEQCDNGPFNSNTNPNACRTDCTLPRCGDQVIDLGETCDAGHQTAVCDANCTAVVCGDGTPNSQAGEQCDTGGASATCDADCTVPVCGDGVFNLPAGEQCDNGAGNSNTTPNACRTNCHTAACGDSVTDSGETCDTGGNSAACDANCTAPACGDGFANPAAGEQCDTAGNSATCDSNCTTPVCGDGLLNTAAGEQCDNGGANSNTAPNACRTNCLPARCGDAVTDAGEQCDDGNASNTDACRTTCVLAVCGDGFVRAGVEQCDDANLVAGDGCGPTCQSEFCGDGVIQPALSEICDNGAANSDTTPYACREDCQPATCGDGTIDQRPTPPLEFIDDGGVEQWSGGALVQWSTFLNGGDVAQNSTVQRSGASCAEVTRQRAGSLGIYQIVFGLDPGFEFRLSGWTKVNPGATTTGFPTVRVRNVTRNQYLQANGTWAVAIADALVGGVRADGAWTEFALVFRTPATHAVTDSYQIMLIHQTSSPVSSKVFHDDIRLTGPLAEQCDDGNLVDRDQCSSSCTIEAQWCGDGVRNGPEECDDANTVQTDACLNACTLARCGDGIVRTGFEQCDDGNASNVDNCSNACVVNFCGDGVTQTGRGEECDDANAVNDDVCSNVCLLTGGFCGDGIRQQGLGEACDDGNAVNNDNCSNTCVVNFCGDGIEQTARGEQCDDGNAAIGDGCRPNCTDEVCGDGIKDPQEGCDDGDLQSGDGCSAACVVERCGDGIVQGGLGEDCDDANLVNDDLCSNTCHSTNAFCGNGFTELGIGEECDDANGVNDDTCDNACQLTGFYCGDGVVQPGLSEQCDDGNSVPDDLCNNLCRFTNAFCGNGQVEHGIGEQCDDGNAELGDGCRPDCTTEGCGDGIIDPGEECDDGDLQSWDGCQTDCVSDLFLRVNKQHQGGALPPLITLDWTGEHPRFEIFRSINDRTAVGDPFNLMDEVSGYTWPDPGTPTTRGFIAYYDVTTLCGNGTLDPSEACDDGNNMSLDGCRSNCDTESCGDGMVDAAEDCDDGNLLAGDGCRADCTIEGCGDGRVDPGEECDDGNGTSGDGCSAGCLSEDCGNGRLETGEECDDANASNFDDCLNSCDNATCGDGYQRTGTEQCDDGDLAGGDGCGATCTREFGWSCVGNAPSLCTQNCTDQDGDTFDNCNPGIEGDDGKPADCNVSVAACTTDCVTDADNDGIPNCADTCLDPDLDGFGVGSGCTADNCASEFNPDQLNSDAGLLGDVCDPCPADTTDACNQAQSVGTNVGATGGTVTTADGRVSIVIPAGALATNRSISATEGAPGVVAGANGVAMASRLLPAAQTFLAPVTASFRWLDADANGIVDGSSPAISEGGLFVFQDGTQIGGPCSDPAYQAGTCTTACCDAATNTWTVRVSHFSTFLISAAGCGNGVVEPGEACDDGNAVQGDGCHNNCTLPACGDGIVDPGESCDDGNVVTGDGCSATCGRLRSDDFSGCGLDPRWTFVNPQNDASYSISGTGGTDARLNIVVPAGLIHDALAVNGAPRVLQPIDNSNLQIVVKMESGLSQATQLQGVIVQQDPSNYIRFDFYSNGTRWFAFAAVVKNGTVTTKINQQMPLGASPNPLYLRVTRTSNLWQHEHSTNGTSWTSNGSFSEPLTASAAGVFAGNFASGGPTPAHTAVFDYFFNAASPIAPEDGSAPGPARMLTVTPGAGGGVTVDPLAAAYYCEDEVTLTAVPNPGFAFTGWGGDLTGTVNPETLTMDVNHTVTASFTSAAGAPVISNLQVEEFDNRATITWDTNEPASSRVDYGLTAGYGGSVSSGALVLQHSLTIFGLDASTTYHFSVSSTDGDLDTASTTDDTFTTLASVDGPIDSDDFNACTVDPLWTFVDPLGDASYRAVGGGSGQAELWIEVPAGNAHAVTSVNHEPRLVQPVAGDPDFQLEVKFDSRVSLGNQSQGLVVEDTPTHWLSFDVVSTGTQTRVAVVKVVNGTRTVLVDQLLVSGASPLPLWLRVTRTGDSFMTETSLNGATWTPMTVSGGGSSFVEVLTARKVGVTAGNAVANPKHVAKFDYFFETSLPVIPEDGLAVGGTGYELTATAVGPGAVTVDPDRDFYYCDEEVALTAGPNAGSVFTGWSDDLSGILNPETLTMSADRTATASFTADTIAPIVDLITVTPGDTFADVCWVTNEPANSRVDYGVFAPDEGSASAAAFVLERCVRVTGLVPDTDYLFTVTSVDQEALPTTSPTDAFHTLAQPPGSFESDDFNHCALDLGLWTFVNPLGDASYSLVGGGTSAAKLQLVVPSAISHDAYDTNNAPRLMQPAANTNFQIEVKLESLLTAAGFQFEGLMIEQDAANWIRVDFVSSTTQLKLFAGSTAAGVTTPRLDLVLGGLPAAGPRWLRVTRAGNTFTVEHSDNGLTWTNDGNFNATLTVTRVGVFAGNAINNPAHTAVFDYFFDAGNPIVPEDGGISPDGAVLTTSVVGGGSIGRNPNRTFYCDGPSVILTAVPQQNWVFSGWSGALTGTTNPQAVIMDQDRSVTATFVPPPNCGNGSINGGEQCDDGNNSPGDGCSAVCLIEGCGNGSIDGGEECDDANGVVGDGCRPDCTLEVCGDGIVDPGEECDDGPAVATPNWHGGARRYRLALQVAANGFARTDRVVDASLNLQTTLSAAGGSGTVNLNSLALVEVSNTGTLVDGSVPFQWDGTSTGTLVWLLEGATGSSATRYYHLYFDTVPFSPAAFSDQVVVTDNIQDAGQSSYRVATGMGTYYFQKEAAGFSSLLDAQGNDWISFSPTPGSESAGEYRGVPNLAFPANIYHPGFTSASSSLMFDGPLKATIESPSDNGQFRTRWEFYPGYAKLTVLQATGTYWFLYEGTPGGVLTRTGPNADFFVRSDGTVYPITTDWGAGQAIPGDEWVYFADPAVTRSLFLAQHTDVPGQINTYLPLDLPSGGPDSDWMTVFGFGRSGTSSSLTGAPRQFTIGLIDTTAFGTAEGQIQSAYKDVSVTSGPAQGIIEELPDACRTNCNLPACGDGIVDSGEQCDDGNVVNGDGCQATCQLPTSGFVLSYGLEEADAVTTVFDNSGHGRNGTLLSPATRTASGKYGRAVDVNGAGGSVSMGTLDLAGTGLTISMWVQADGFGISDARLVSKASGVNLADHLWMISTQPVAAASRLRGRLKTDVGGTTEFVATSGDLSAATWTYVSMTYDGANLKLFKDCAEVGSVAKTGSISQNAAATALLGDQPAGGGKSFDGRIDEVRFLAFAETPAECAISRATPVACGNGAIDGGFETCDDGNNTSGDGCSSVCVREPACGDGFLDAGEACDDGNLSNGDCCSATCSFEIAGSACSDGQFCTVSDTCDGSGTCTSGGPRNCADADVCTDDSCDEPADTCRHVIDLSNHPSCTTCGDGVEEGLEQCDDGNTTSSDGCSATCQDEFCGDGVTQAGLGEACDDGNAVEGDGCDSNCTATACGNGIQTAGEACDDGDAVDGDGCDSNCTATACGNGIETAGEACDDGDAVDGDGCDSNCTATACGNGIQTAGEACDDGNAVDGDGCDSNCTATACGNGIQTAGEACDNGGLNSDTTPDACRTNCLDPHCGDAVTDSGEACDDGNTTPGDGCSATCSNEIVCGNGTIDVGETCDDGNTTSGDGCSATCDRLVSDLFDTPSLNAAVWTEVDPRNDTDVDHDGGRLSIALPDAANHDAWPPSATFSGTNDSVRVLQNADNSDFRVVIKLDSTVNAGFVTQGILVEQDLHNWMRFDVYANDTQWFAFAAKVVADVPTFFVNAVGGSGVGAAGDSPVPLYLRVTRSGNSWTFERSTNGFVWTSDGPAHPHTMTVNRVGVFGGNFKSPGTPPAHTALFDFFIETSACGNGTVDAFETCDDGNASNTDACLNNCTPNVCGDGVLDGTEEQCDDGNTANGDCCSATCSFEAASSPCSDGAFCTTGETCNGSGVCGGATPNSCADVDVCTDDACNEASDTCEHVFDGTNAPACAVCGNSVVEPPEQCDDGNTAPGDGCSATCTIESVCGNGDLEAGEACDDGDLVNGDGCDSNCTVTACGNGVVAGSEVCDDGNVVSGDGCDSNCTVTACGNGVIAGSEVCDDGNVVSGDGCDSNCTVTACGNGVVAGSEVCDDGNVVSGDGCDANCTVTACGNGVVTGSEVCDDGNVVSGDGCDANCTVTACGNGVIAGSEVCDDGNVVNGDGCDANCTVTACGNGVVTGVEACDDGNTTPGDGCSATCTFETVCGNGILQAGEACDDSNLVDGDGCDSNCTLTACGNGVITVGEICDDGNTSSGDGCSATCKKLVSDEFDGASLDATRWTVINEVSGSTASQSGGQVSLTVLGTASHDLFPPNTDALRMVQDVDDSDFRVVIKLDSPMAAAGADRYRSNGFYVEQDAGNWMRFDVYRDNSAWYVFAAKHIGGTTTVLTNALGGVDSPPIPLYLRLTRTGDSWTYERSSDGVTFTLNGVPETQALTVNRVGVFAGNVVSGGEPTHTASFDWFRDTSACGNGTVQAGEACDDGNASNADACLDNCAVAACGDGFVETGVEDCDDANTSAGDGCSATCAVESGFSCSGTPSVCTGICGDGAIVGTETCDDAGTASGDGCSATCAVESGFSCSGTPSVCTGICGDGAIVGTETCDDAGTASGDGCSATCAVESGFSCSGTPSVCTGICGDGAIVGTETCDDAGTASGDGCSATCAVESGFSCSGTPSVCTGICGDGAIVGTETCDDGDLDDGDGCSSTCAVEAGWSCTGAPSVCTM